MSKETHVFTQDVIVPGLGRKNAGDLTDADECPGAWKYLTDYGFVKDMKSLEAEADAEADKPEKAAATSPKPATKKTAQENK